MPAANISFEAIGTRWRITIAEPVTGEALDVLKKKISGCIDAFDRDFSRFRPDSLVAQMAREAGTYSLTPAGYRLLKLYHQLYLATEGRVTPLIGQTMVEAGYDADYSLQPKPLHRPPRWDDVIALTSGKLSLAKPALLDVGAAGKGCLVDLVGEAIESAGVQSYTVDAGGDILHRSARGEMVTIGLENPRETTEAVGVAQLGNRSLCASSGSKRSWGKYHHIIDPESLQSPRRILSTWVMADHTMLADGLATALFFASPTRLREQFDFAWAILEEDMGLTSSRDFPLTAFTHVP